LAGGGVYAAGYWVLDSREMKTRTPNKVTGANAGGPRQLPIRTPQTARVAQFCRSAEAVRWS
jgi:hypothetical protein